VNDEYELPDCWEVKPLGETAKLVKDKVEPSTVPDAYYVGLEHVEAHTMKLLGRGRGSDVKSAKTRFKAGDILYGKLRPYLNKVARPSFDGISSTDFLVFTESDYLDPGYLAQFLNQLSVANFAHHLSAGVELPRVDWKSLASLPITFPSSKRQQRAIVQSIEHARTLAASTNAHLSRAKTALDRFRQAVLSAACSGRLTTDWREEKSTSPSDLELGKSKSPKHLRSLSDYELDELPEGWKWVQVEDLLPPGGIFDGPFGSNLKSSDYTSSGARVVRLENIGHLKFIGEKQTFVSPEKFRALQKHAVRSGDIIFSSFVEEKVRVCVLPDILDTEAIAKADCFTLRPFPIIDRHYLALQLASMTSYCNLADDIHGATRPRVNTTQVRGLPVPLCSIEEQREIVKRFYALIEIAARQERRIEAAFRRIDYTSQAILAKAFRGELIMSGEEGAGL